MVINELLRMGLSIIGSRRYGNPVLETRLILANLLGVDKTYIYVHGDQIVDKEIKDKFLQLVEKRSKGYPLQYILEKQEFMGLDLYIEEGILVPRPDTEILIEYIIGYVNENHKDEKINIIELGIGSGAISLSLAYYLKNTNIYGVDIDEIPIKVANINKERLKIDNASFFKGDLFQGIENENLEGKTSIVVSNPPYIKKEEIDKLQDEVRFYEPRLALDGGYDGLDFYRRITPESLEFLIPGGLLIYEIGYDQGDKVKEIMVEEGFKRVEVLKDLRGLDRVVLGFKD